MADISAVSSVTISGRTVFGNKRITWGYVTLGNGTDTMPAAGLAVTAANLGLAGVDVVMCNNETLPYHWTSNVLHGTGAGTPASADKVYFLAVGYGAHA